VAVVSMKQLLEAGVHFGHRSRRWHPKMRSYIFTERNGIHIIDLQQTIRMLDEAYSFSRDTAAEGGTILFVGTKRQAQENIEIQAQRCGMPYVTLRWLGGTLTNFRTIRKRCDYLIELEKQKELGEFSRLTKKEALWKERELLKLQKVFGGIKNMYYLPSAIFVADIMRETIAVKEANILDIPVIAMVDTNCDPDPIDYVIPANDDAIRAIKLVATKIADAVIEGQQMRGVIMAEEGEEEAAEEMEMAAAAIDLSSFEEEGSEFEEEVSEETETAEELETEEAEAAEEEALGEAEKVVAAAIDEDDSQE
jgi:small subunit ribosomal protein S2